MKAPTRSQSCSTLADGVKSMDGRLSDNERASTKVNRVPQELTPADIEAVLGSYQAIDDRDVDRLMELSAPDVKIVTRVESYDGIEGARTMYREAFGADFTNRPEMMILRGNRVISLTSLRLVGDRTGIETEQKLIEVWTVEDGLVRYLEVLDREPGVESLELAEQLAEIEYLRGGYDAFNRGDFDEVLTRMSPEVVMNRGEAMLETDPIRGEREVRQFFEPDVFAEQRLEIGLLIAAGDRILTIATMHARTSGQGVELSTRVHQLWTMAGGKVVRSDLFQERDEALAALLADD